AESTASNRAAARAGSADPIEESAVLERAEGHSAPPGSSTEQRDAGRGGAGREPAPLRGAAGARVEVDGADAGRRVLVECWAHQGAPKAAQRHKVLADALKLPWIPTTIYPRPRLLLFP